MVQDMVTKLADMVTAAELDLRVHAVRVIANMRRRTLREEVSWRLQVWKTNMTQAELRRLRSYLMFVVVL